MEVFHKQSTALGSLGLGISQCFSLCRWTFPFLTKHAACHVSPTGPKKNHWILRFSTGDVRFTADVPGIGSLQLGPFGANHKGPLPKCCNRPGGYQILPDDIENCHLVRWFAIEDGAFPSFLYVYQRVIIYIINPLPNIKRPPCMVSKKYGNSIRKTMVSKGVFSNGGWDEVSLESVEVSSLLWKFANLLSVNHLYSSIN